MTAIEPLTQSEDASKANTPVSEQSIVICRNLTKQFKDFWLRNRVTAVSDVNLTIRRGEVFGLLGPNGSGKSTTIKMILGLLKPTKGKIGVFGNPPSDTNTKKRIGYLPEESYLYRFLNARETLEYYARLFEQNGTQRRHRIDTLLDMVGLTHAQRRPIGEYSKGMQRKVGLAQALINDPEFLILDEPTTGMDPIATADVKKLILTLKQRGKTVLLCSHLLADVEDVCDRVAIMFGGKVRQAGTVDELLTQDGLTTLATDDLDAQDIEAVEALLVQRGRRLEGIKRPRRRLEELFLEIVEQAQQEGLSTSGARSGGDIADFLSDESQAAKEIEGEAVVDSLLTEQPPAEDVKTSNEPVKSEPESSPTVPEQQSTLDALMSDEPTSSAEPVKPKTTQTPSEPSKPAASADHDLIDSLLDEDKPQSS